VPQRKKQNVRLGEQIDRLVRSLAATKGWKMVPTTAYICQRTSYGPDMVHRWRQGNIRPSPETLEILVQVGKEEANLPREWGESLLNAGHYFDALNLINTLWGPKAIRSIPCNLPSPDRTHLLGRESEIAFLQKLLSPNHAAHLITVDGIGGVGKTALVLEVAYRCWRVSTGEYTDSKVSLFDAIIFVSAKQQYLTSDGILRSNEAKRTRREIIREIASTLNRTDITYAPPKKQFSEVHKALAQQRTLLIVDNMETMSDVQEIVSFLFELPPTVKVVITTREQKYLFSPIHLNQLSQDDALEFIERESREKGIEVSRKKAIQLYKHIGGIPAALIYAIGQLAHGYSVTTVLEQVPKVTGEVARYCFKGSVEPLRGQPAHHLLMAMGMFPKSPSDEALAYAAGFENDQSAKEEGLTVLSILSLIRPQEKQQEIEQQEAQFISIPPIRNYISTEPIMNTPTEQVSRYVMLPLTREYALSELAAHTSFEQQARVRWVTWYKNYAQLHAGKDWNDWRVHYDHLDEEWENLLTVFDWCAYHEQYDLIRFFWQEMHIVKFAQIYGYWDDRVSWLYWLIQAAEKRGDWSIVVKSIVDLGSTLTLMSRYEDASRLFQKALGICRHADHLSQLLLMQKISYLNMQQEDYASARVWLDQAAILLKNMKIDDRELTRRRADYFSYEALLFYKQKEYEQAEQYYRMMLELAQSNGQERVVSFAQNHLAYIAIAQNRLNEADKILHEMLPIHKDKRLEALHKSTLANFFQKKGSLDEARSLANEALKGFEYLGMKQEAQEVGELLHVLQD
jgi:tetratricopeptide (TPR) repeat protein